MKRYNNLKIKRLPETFLGQKLKKLDDDKVFSFNFQLNVNGLDLENSTGCLLHTAQVHLENWPRCFLFLFRVQKNNRVFVANNLLQNSGFSIDSPYPLRFNVAEVFSGVYCLFIHNKQTVGDWSWSLWHSSCTLLRKRKLNKVKYTGGGHGNPRLENAKTTKKEYRGAKYPMKEQ